MFKKLAKSILIVGVASSLASPVSAESQYYVGGGIAFLDFSVDGVSDEASWEALYGRIGVDIDENFSAEIRAGAGVDDDSIFGVDVDLDNFFGAYIRAGVPVTEYFFPYAVLGYTRAEVTASVPGYSSESESESDVSFGAGADIKVNNNLSINVEYTNYYDKDDEKIDGISISAVTYF